MSKSNCRDSTGYTCSSWMLSSFRSSSGKIDRRKARSSVQPPSHAVGNRTPNELPTMDEFIKHIEKHGGQDWNWREAMVRHDPRRSGKHYWAVGGGESG
ncbi:hypothetical protein BDZ85DRAFT_268803 [Elsinoe ampelina]|uniref:Uncharacterized protein n=1 Tax=Elsinoe ampelina TaxID=302913 RepID=A0A6A6G0W9_9PEZI|nr:hypothetical protein BDZ85DRAFT_268803 [Elsinoe ampelina]